MKTIKVQPMARVCPVASDARQDYWLSEAEALAKYEAGELSRDLTNSRPGASVYMPVKEKK